MIDEGTYGRGRAYLAWFDDEDGEEGAAVGQDGLLSIEELEAKVKNPEGYSDREYWIAELAAKRFCSTRMDKVDYSSMYGWVFDSKKLFKEYKATVLAALEVARADVQYPAWVELALAAGWKMPKGWKP